MSVTTHDPSVREDADTSPASLGRRMMNSQSKNDASPDAGRQSKFVITNLRAVGYAAGR
jgi:hypothetical protein